MSKSTMRGSTPSIKWRDFFGLAGAAIAATGAALAGCSPQQTSVPATGDAADRGGAAGTTAGGNGGTPSFMTPPDPIDDADIAETIDTDVLVIGGGPGRGGGRPGRSLAPYTYMCSSKCRCCR